MSTTQRIKAAQQSRLRAGVGASNDAVYTPPAPELMQRVHQVLKEFAQSDYALEICKYCDVPPTARGTPRALFDEVRMEGTTVVVFLTRQAEGMSGKLFDRLKALFAERMRGEVTKLQYETKSPPTIKTYVV